ncbi:hypothetical protein HPB47_019445 [Ixodes persulcatus]|uniref:Uncharacterized protein n=1 Tax=Ixodes persulcatus TaxID=34615 RepID=A0AC60QLR4_IXOPE|nr:hypothetical protein HPB47_019445 [Ixodes persulcatus]
MDARRGAHVDAAPADPRQRQAQRTRRELTSPKSKFNKNVRASVIKAVRMSAMPLEERKIVFRPRGGLDIVKTGTTTVASAILAAAKIKSEESATDTICPNTQQNIMVASTPNEDNAARYATIKEISIQGKPYEVSAYLTAPHDTVKGVIRGIPIDASADELDRNIVNERNPLAVSAKWIRSTTTVIVTFHGPKVPNFVRYGVTLLPCHLYRKQIDVCQQCGRVGHRKDVCPILSIMTCLACGLANPKQDHPCTPKSNETLRKENVALRKTVNNLTREIAEIRKLLLCNNESLQRPTPSTNKTEETTTNNQETDVAEPALKKRAVETTRKQNESDRIDKPEVKFEARFTKLEELITANIAAVTVMKKTMETCQAENMNRFAYIEKTLQPIVSHPTFAPLFAQHSPYQETQYAPTQLWPPAR